MRKALTGFFWLLAASCALAQGLPGLTIPPGLIAGGGVTLGGTFNPSDKDSNVVLSNGNLTMTNADTTYHSVRSTNSVSSGLYYFEYQISGVDVSIGVGNASAPIIYYASQDANSVAYSGPNGSIYKNGTLTVTGPGIGAANDIIGVKVDRAGGTVAFNKNGGAFTATTTLPSGAIYLMASTVDGAVVTLKATPAYAIPAGYNFWGN